MKATMIRARRCGKTAEVITIGKLDDGEKVALHYPRYEAQRLGSNLQININGRKQLYIGYFSPEQVKFRASFAAAVANASPTLKAIYKSEVTRNRLDAPIETHENNHVGRALPKET